MHLNSMHDYNKIFLSSIKTHSWFSINSCRSASSPALALGWFFVSQFCLFSWTSLERWGSRLIRFLVGNFQRLRSAFVGLHMLCRWWCERIHRCPRFEYLVFLIGNRYNCCNLISRPTYSDLASTLQCQTFCRLEHRAQMAACPTVGSEDQGF